MPGLSRVGVDSAGGIITGMLQDGTVSVNGSPVSVNGDPVAPHGVSPHGPTPPTMIAGSNSVFINGIAAVNAGDAATCGHTASGSGDVGAGD